MKGTVVVNTDQLTRKTTVETSPDVAGSKRLADLAANAKWTMLIALWGSLTILVVGAITKVVILVVSA